MDKYNETFETWNKIANLYEDKFKNLSIYDETYDFFCCLLKDHQKVFEIGCGPGNITKYLLSKRPDLKITGIDIAPKMIELAQINNPTADFKIMDTRKLNELNEKFDAIMCGFCLPYLSESDCSKLISDSAKILAENGNPNAQICATIARKSFPCPQSISNLHHKKANLMKLIKSDARTCIVNHEISNMKVNLQFIKNPKNIFLIDGFGALLTAFLIFFVLRTFNDFFGLSKSILEYLAALALVFSIYSVSCYFLVSDNWKSFLKIICIANILYCILTIGILFYHYLSISIFGITYFLGEIAVITGIVFLEIKMILEK